MFSIKSVDSNKLLGCCGLCYINWIHRNADLSIYIGWENAYIDEEGFAEESCKLLQDYGFNQLGLHRIWTEIYEFDEKKKKLYEKLNFHVDGILRDNYYYDGKWWNSYMFSILNCL
jgi:RimJ/RimL family protein N-acetyltransferase